MSRIFICYRRKETAPHTGRLHDRLVGEFGQDQVFIDIDTIEPGEDFVEILQKAVSASDILIVVIGPQWVTITDDSGHRRLDDPEDFVRIEVASALKRKIRVIPVLVEGATMPHSSQLPKDLAALTRRNALEISNTRFHTDVDRLIESVRKLIRPKSGLMNGRWRRWIIGFAVVAFLIGMSFVAVSIMTKTREPGIYLEKNGQKGDQLSVTMMVVVPGTPPHDRPTQVSHVNGMCLVKDLSNGRVLEWRDVDLCDEQ